MSVGIDRVSPPTIIEKEFQMVTMMAEVLYPNYLEISEPKIGAWISGAGKVTGKQRARLERLLPSEANVRYRNGTFLIEMDVPLGQRSRVSVRDLAEKIRSAISRSLRVRAGLCPVTSSARVLDLTRRG